FYGIPTRDAHRAAPPGGLQGSPRLADHDAGHLHHRAHGRDRHSGRGGRRRGHPHNLTTAFPPPTPSDPDIAGALEAPSAPIRAWSRPRQGARALAPGYRRPGQTLPAPPGRRAYGTFGPV